MRNGSFPGAPAGGHNTHVGTLPDAVPVAPPDDPPVPVDEEAVDRTLVRAVGVADDVLVVPPPEVTAVAALPAVEPAVVVPVAVEDVDGAAVVAVVVFAPVVAVVGAVVLLPSLTMPWLVTP